MLLPRTDAMLEAKRGKEEYGMDRLAAVDRANARRRLENVAGAVMEDVRYFTRNVV